MATSKAKFRVQHVATAPRGWKVRSKRTGDHVVRIAFPPGRRRRGSGKLLEVLHPKKNPSCQEGSCAPQQNPQELIIFGNPSGALDSYARRHLSAWIKSQGYKPREGADVRKKILAVVREHPDLLKSPDARSWPEILRIAGDNPLAAAKSKRATRRRRKNSLIDEIRHGDRVTFLDRFGKQRTGKAVMRGPHGWVLNMGGPHGTPAVVSEGMIVKVRKGNPGQMHVFFDGLLGKWVASIYDPKFGNLFSADDAKAEAIKKLKQQIQDFHTGKRHHNRAKRHRKRRNPVSETEQAVKLFETFHGKDPRAITEKHLSAAMRKDYTALGDLLAIGTDACGYGEKEIAQKWDHCPHIGFQGDHVVLASSPDGRQLYAIGGNQNLNGCLSKFEGVDPSKDFVDLGDVAFVVYLARKIHSNFEPVEWVHKFGGVKPRWMFDRLKKQIFFIGGEYFIDLKAEISPGIEG